MAVMAVCRACLGPCGSGAAGAAGARALFQAGRAQALAALTGLQILQEDHLPEVICLACNKELCISQLFIKKALESHEILYGNLEKSKKLNGNITEALFDDLNNVDTESYGNKSIEYDFLEEFITADKNYNNLDTILDQTACFFEKSTQVNFECQHQDANIENDYTITSPDCNIIISDEFPEFDRYNNFSLLHESEIKQEPEEEELPCYNIDNLENDLPVSNIKVEPLSENDALKFHQESISNFDNNIECEEYLESDVNGYMSQGSTYSEGDTKPSEEELRLHSLKYNMDDDSLHEKGNSDPNSCNICGKVLANQMGLWRHIQIHKTHQICMLCNRCFRTRQRLKSHVLLHHSYGEIKKCSSCDLTFKSSVDLALHQEIHVIPTISIPCNLCFKNFDSEYDLKEHMNYHREIVVLKKGDEEYTLCSKCNKAFTDPKALFSHVKYVCQISEFPNNDELFLKNPDEIKSEIKIEVSESRKGKILKQNFNGKTFKKKSREHACSHCTMTFSNKYFLRIHLDQHSSFTRGFCCPICSFKFKRKDHLTRHLNNVHSVEKEKPKPF